MDKKIKKRMDAARKRLEKLRRQLAGARAQMDDPAEVTAYQEQIAAAEAELKRLKELS
jgi:DNA-binding FrmR family transcriptional regulator